MAHSAVAPMRGRSSDTWPAASPAARFSALPLDRPRSPCPRFADLPFDILARVAAAFPVPDLLAASSVCRAWRDALLPLRQAVPLLRSGKRYKHGAGSVRRDAQKAMEAFLKGVELGSAAAMVDAGLMYWEMGRKEEGMGLYRRAAECGYPAGMCNLGVCYLEANPPEPWKAVQLFYQAAQAGYARAQYNLARCLQKGHGVNCNMITAVQWYLRAAEGGNPHAMYKISRCYSSGEGLTRDMQRAKIWMKRAADNGDKNAQYNYGLDLFSSGDAWRALYYFELATRAGVAAAKHVRDALLQSVPATSRDYAIGAADRWQSARSRRHH